jgi:hypothetical protein
MGALEVNLNVLVLMAILVGSAALGYVFRSAQIKSAKKKILALEKEMLSSHAQILALQEKLSRLQVKDKSNIPVIPLKSVSSTEEKVGRAAE